MLKAESNLSETTDRAAALLEELRSRLHAETPRENTDDLDQELQAYFSATPHASVLTEIRDRVVEGVVDRIMRAWEDPKAPRSSALEEVVVERLIERVLERLGKDPNAPR